MRIVTSYQPSDIAQGFKKINVNSNHILLSAIYLSGLMLGSILYQTAGLIRSFSDHILQNTLVQSSPLSELCILLAVIALGTGTVLFGSGLSLVGYPCIYLTPFCMGILSALFSISFFEADISMGIVKNVLLQPLFAAAVCTVLSMCGYSADMSGALIHARGSRGAGDAQKYAVRILLLTAVAIVCAVLLSCLVVLLRHIQ